MKRILVLLTAAVLGFAACSDNKEDDNPQTPDNGAIALYTKVIGRWSFSGVELDAPGIYSRTAHTRKSAIAKTADNLDSFIEFLSDSTYYIYDSKGGFFSGTFSAKDSTTIALGSFGTLRNVTFTQTAINFILTYDGKDAWVVGTKAPSSPVSDSSKLLGKEWFMTRQYAAECCTNRPVGLLTQMVKAWAVLCRIASLCK